jgi:predicted DNA-binding transcriptional regulator AlpA
MNNTTHTPATLLPFKEGLRRLGLKPTRYYDWADKNSPRFRPELPRRLKIGVSSFFLEAEIERFILSLMGKN